jgi:hypothetical protein
MVVTGGFDSMWCLRPDALLDGRGQVLLCGTAQEELVESAAGQREELSESAVGPSEAPSGA